MREFFQETCLKRKVQISFSERRDPTNLFYRYLETDSNDYMERQRAPIANTILKNTFQGLMLPDIKTHHEATVIKTCGTGIYI